MSYVDVVITKPKEFKIGSYLIRVITKRKFSHCALIWENFHLGLGVAYQATIGGVQFWSSEKFLAKNTIVKKYKIAVSEEQKKLILKKAFELAGNHYGYMSIIGIAMTIFASYVFSLFSNKRVNFKVPFSDGVSTSVCSELIGYVVLQTIFKNHIPEGDLDNLTVNDLDELLEKLTLIYPEQIKLANI